MFLIRAAFWLIILVLLLPTDEKQQNQVYGTAEAAVKDVSGFCERNPGVCATGREAVDVFVSKAQYGGKMLADFVMRQAGFGEDAESGEADVAEESGDPDSAAMALAPSDSWSTAVEPDEEETQSQNTLNPDDLAPVWGGSPVVPAGQ